MSERRSKMKPPRRSSQISNTSSSSESTSSFSSDDEETDARDLKPIKDYLNDRRELASQLFKSVKLEKIRMMLPQALKKMNLYDLEELCGNELSGMSRRRILSIINGQHMMESSDTDETDDSGPSLEIISDTEEWLTDDEVMIKEENASSAKSKAKKNIDKVKGKVRPLSKDKTKLKPKTTSHPGKDSKSADVSVKVEGEKAEPKEGESLLDLLELEMRARAIRALIRKEEDIIPGKTTSGTSSAKNATNATVNPNPSGSKYVVQEMQQINVTLKQGSGLDDDVMLVIQPAPTIELLSSESENEIEKDKKEDNKRVNQRLENERETVKEDESKCVNQRLKSERESEKEEQTKRVNKRLENERGTETTHSTSTIGDETVEIQDNDESKKEEQSPLDNERNEAEPFIEVIEKLQKSPERLENKETNKALDKSHDKVLNEPPDKTTNKTSDRTSDKILNESTENPPDIAAHKPEDKKEEDQEKIQDKKSDKATNEPESITKEPEESAESSEKPPEKQKSPKKELEEGELTSDSDSKEEAEVLDINIKRHLFNKGVKRRRHIRQKVHESCKESQDPDQNETVESESEVSEKAINASQGKPTSRRKIRDNTMNEKEINSKEIVNEGTKEKDNIEESSAKKKVEAPNEVEGQKKEQKKNELKKKQEDVDKTDMEEIIDLDAYPDDMDDLENNEQSKSNDPKKSSGNNKTIPESSTEKTEPAETWASRYYNTDDVQNVIKESKIQSEIRKRLRERQRISKLNNSPNANTTGNNCPVDIKVEEAKQKPLGSVEEYLALKAATIDSSVNEKTESLTEKSGKSCRKSDSLRKSKSHISKKRFKSDKKSEKDDETSSARKKDAIIETSVESRPD